MSHHDEVNGSSSTLASRIMDQCLGRLTVFRSSLSKSSPPLSQERCVQHDSMDVD